MNKQEAILQVERSLKTAFGEESPEWSWWCLVRSYVEDDRGTYSASAAFGTVEEVLREVNPNVPAVGYMKDGGSILMRSHLREVTNELIELRRQVQAAAGTGSART